MQTLTAKELKQGITPDMIQAAKAVFETMALVGTIKPIVEGYQNKILEYEKYEYAEKNLERHRKTREDYIKREFDTFLMSDSDFKHYLNRCREEQEKAGLKAPSGCCPLLVAESLQRKAERVLVDTMEPITKLTADYVLTGKNALENYKKLIDLILRLLAPFVK